MASDQQFRANRKNAKKSTGPRTRQGKAVSARNALRHGLTARQIVMDGEDPALYDALRGRLIATFAPASPIEEILVERLAGLIWRLRRVPIFETALISWVLQQQAEMNGTTAIELGRSFLTTNTTQDSEMLSTRDTHERQVTGRMINAVLRDQDPLGRLGRYETQLMRQVERTLAELERLARKVPRGDYDHGT